VSITGSRDYGCHYWLRRNILWAAKRGSERHFSKVFSSTAKANHSIHIDTRFKSGLPGQGIFLTDASRCIEQVRRLDHKKHADP
jgi:hypothetical protein